MDGGSLSVDIDLYHTLESGQTYLWNRSDGLMYQSVEPTADTWYETIANGVYIGVRREGALLQWRSTDGEQAAQLLQNLLRLGDDLERLYQTFPDEPVVSTALNRFPGMRLVNDPSFPCLISFICSAQMRVPRIFAMQQALTQAYGNEYLIDDRTLWSYPTPEQLASATEEELRSLGVGYRAPYIRDTAQMVVDGIDPVVAEALPYEEARSYLTQFPGVGEKVADCVLLFSLDTLEAVPLDTWIQQAISEYFPDCDRGSYAATSQALRNRFGQTYAGYVQTYVFHHLRTNPER